MLIQMCLLKRGLDLEGDLVRQSAKFHKVWELIKMSIRQLWAAQDGKSLVKVTKL